MNPMEPKRACSHPGCRQVVVSGKCSTHRRERTEKPRPKTAERGYGGRWQRASEAYRRCNPICVAHALHGDVVPARCVDHIVPIRCCPELQWDEDNWQSLCWICHTAKTRQDPTEPWHPLADHVVVCGLPGSGKTTYARSTGLPYWDADEQGLQGVEQIRSARAQWIARHSGPCVVIVASTFTAPHLAAAITGRVKHMTEQHVERMPL